MFTRCVFLVLFLSVFAASCVIEKRHYRNGFYVGRGNSLEWKQAHCIRDSFPGLISQEICAIPEQNHPAPVSDTILHAEEADRVLAPVKPEDCNSESRRGKAEQKDDPQPEKSDRINPKIAGLTAGGFILELTLGLILLFGTVSWVGWFVLLTMLFGLGMFAFAMYLRSKYVMRTAAGEKDPKLKLSAHYHRFRILLHMYFAAGAIGLLGWFFLYTAGASGILSLLGVILFSSGVVLLAGIALVLLVLFFLYFIRWRKDPTGYKPPRDPHPPKDH